MCEYCGCQDADPIFAELTAEHDQLRCLGRELLAAAEDADATRVGGVAAQMMRILDPHTQVEERGLFPGLAADFPAQIAALEADHVAIESVLAELADGSPEDNWPDRARRACSQLFEHILKEQDGVFPAALITLTENGWRQLAAAHAARSSRPAATSVA
jgi:hemerythrin-like domain-containing protein